MAEMTIRLRIDPNTGRKDIIVSLSSDADALPHEHEQQHKALVEKLLEGGVIKAAELGQVIVERDPLPPTPLPEGEGSKADRKQQGQSS